MTVEDRKFWERRHASEAGEIGPSNFLQLIFSEESWSIGRGKALDIACGKGRNAIYLAERGFQVEGIDISENALDEARRVTRERNLSIEFRQEDLDHVKLLPLTYALILNVNFLDRSLIPKIKESLMMGGHVVFDTYLLEQRFYGHPRNPAYLLGHNELLNLFGDFRILCYQEGKFAEEGKESFRASLLGVKVR